MTDREALIVLTAGFADTEYTTANAVDEAIDALRLIDAYLASKAVKGQQDLFTMPEWAVAADGYLRDVRRDGQDGVIALFEAGRWIYWERPETKPEDRIDVGTFNELVAGVRWDCWSVVQ